MVTVDEIRKITFDAVMDHGHAVIHSGPDDNVPAPYSYTSGRTMKERPELIVTGMPRENAARLLNELALYDDYVGLETDVAITVAGAQVKLIEANPVRLLAAVVSFGPSVKALQALLSDAAGEWPDTLRGRTSEQPVLPLIPEDAWDPYEEED